MKIKKLIIGLSSIGLLATAAPMYSIPANQVALPNSQSMQILQNLNIYCKLREVKSINKSCENLLSFCSEKDISNIDSRIKIEDGSETGVKEGKIERDDLFTCERTDTPFTAYYRYKSNNIPKNNHTSWGNAKKYQLNVTVPANTKDYKVQVVADAKIKNCIDDIGERDNVSFAQAKLSQLSTDPEDTLMPYIGIKDDNVHKCNADNIKITTQNDLFRTFGNIHPWEIKPYETAKLSSYITLSNETPEAKEIPVYFWYGFFGGGCTGKGKGSHINCSEVTFSANQITIPPYLRFVGQSLDVGGKLTEIESINKSCEKLLTYKNNLGAISNIESRVKIENNPSEPYGKDGKIERDDLFTCERADTQYTSYFRYKCNPIEIKDSNHASWGNAKKYQLNVTVPANTKEYEVQVVADVKIKNCVNSGMVNLTSSFAQAKLSQLSIDPKEILMPYIGIKDENTYREDIWDHFNIKTQNDLFRMFDNNRPWQKKSYDTAKLRSFIILSNETPKAKEIPVYFWYGFFGGGYTGQGGTSQINCSEVTFSTNHIEHIKNI